MLYVVSHKTQQFSFAVCYTANKEKDQFRRDVYGDIVQYASYPDNIWATDGRPKTTHGSIVTKVSGGNLYVSMHSYGDATSDYRYDYLVDDMDYTAKIYLNIVRYYD